MFGANQYGQLGLGHQDEVTTPTQVAGIKAQRVACGYYHTMIIDLDGALYTWGYGSCGELGTGNTSHQNSPTRIECADAITSISCGAHFSMAISSDGSIWTTGYNLDGRLGLGDYTPRHTLHKIDGVTAELGASCGWCHALAVDAQGRLWLWGQSLLLDGQAAPPRW